MGHGILPVFSFYVSYLLPCVARILRCLWSAAAVTIHADMSFALAGAFRPGAWLG